MKSNNKINVIFVFTVYVLPILAAQSIVYDHIKEACPKILKIIQETNFDMGFQKINIRDRYKEVVFFLGMSLRQ